MKIFIFFTAALFLMVGCHPLNQSGKTKLSIAGSSWDYSDSDGDHYQITFIPHGKLKTTNPADETDNNDRWTQKGKTVKFAFNDGYSKYSGSIKSDTLIEGAAKSVAGEWQWKLIKIK